MHHSGIDKAADLRLGVAQGLGAFTMWGLFPLYFKAVSSVEPLEVLAHRIVWSAALLIALGLYTNDLSRVGAIFRNGRTLGLLILSALLLTTNWFVFIKAVANGYVLQSSLGYFINPLVSMVLGRIFLGERLSLSQKVGVGLALAGVVWFTALSGEPPTIALVLGFSFGTYGLLRKAADAPSVAGLTIETLMLAPAAVGYLFYLINSGQAAFLSRTVGMDLLLLAAGIVTTIPLLLFVAGAKRLRLTTMGFIQYITPTLHFLLAVVAFGEPFELVDLVGFCFIWAGLAVYSTNAIKTVRATRKS